MKDKFVTQRKCENKSDVNVFLCNLFLDFHHARRGRAIDVIKCA